jgi:hypothetical protein
MKRYLITSPKFTGTAEIWYNFEGLLCFIDLNECVMTYTQIEYLLAQISPDYETARGLAAGTALKMVEMPFEITLEEFKHEYPYSRNYHLLDAYWPKMPRREQVVAFFAAKQYRKYCERNAGWYKPKIAHAWLGKKEFLNDWRKM